RNSHWTYGQLLASRAGIAVSIRSFSISVLVLAPDSRLQEARGLYRQCLRRIGNTRTKSRQRRRVVSDLASSQKPSRIHVRVHMLSTEQQLKTNSGRGAGLFFLCKHPFDRGARMDRGRIIDRDHVGPDIHREDEFSTAENNSLNLLLREFGDQGLELALAVANDPAHSQLLEDDPVDLVHPAGFDGNESNPAPL